MTGSGTVAVVDYGLGNLRSVAGAIERLGRQPVITSDPAELERAERLILPGVGAFGDGMQNLRERGLVEPLSRLVLEDHRPVLGICLGAQLMAGRSEEHGGHDGLGWIDASVLRLEPDDPSLRVPHVGWNELHQTADSVLFVGVPDRSLFYYVHSFHIAAHDTSLVRGICPYGGRLTAVFERGNVFGTQFHPEKSQLHGLTLLGNFLAYEA
ncbi:MAG TPA: imidazole glycerol phosphate synthase subunit HisH [Gaiellaceae bacterium]|nr:imidazole glycerol phosphate synthase subunit HisH [Gaiellaceae bacterium]